MPQNLPEPLRIIGFPALVVERLHRAVETGDLPGTVVILVFRCLETEVISNDPCYLPQARLVVVHAGELLICLEHRPGLVVARSE